MVVASSNKTPSKKRRSPAQERRSQSKSLKETFSPGLKTPEQRKRSTPKEATYSHLLPTDEQKKANGRVAGRSLIMWGRPRMAEKLLLHLHYECTRHKVAIPWDAIAHRLHPGSSGAAVVQHINRLRKELVSEGHLVPPLAQKPGTTPSIDPTVRGFIREDMHGGDREAVRAVHFGEKFEDAKFNLPDAFHSDGPLDEDPAMPDSPTPQRPILSTPERPFASRSTYEGNTGGDGGLPNHQLPYMDNNWSPTSSFSSPTRQRGFDVDGIDDPLTRSFDTATTGSTKSLATSHFPSEPLGQWEQSRDAWLRSFPHGMPVQPFSKMSAFFQGAIVPQLNPFVCHQPLFTTARAAQDDMASLGGQPSSPSRVSQREFKLEESPLQEHIDFHGSEFEDAMNGSLG